MNSGLLIANPRKSGGEGRGIFPMSELEFIAGNF